MDWDWVGLGWIGLGWIGSDWVGLGWGWVGWQENAENVSIPDSDRGRFFTPLRVRDLTENLSLNSKHIILKKNVSINRWPHLFIDGRIYK